MTQIEANNNLIKELSYCISLLADSDNGCTAEYIIDKYLCPITYEQDKYKCED